MGCRERLILRPLCVGLEGIRDGCICLGGAELLSVICVRMVHKALILGEGTSYDGRSGSRGKKGRIHIELDPVPVGLFRKILNESF
jgi:hypothetical protein